MPGEEGEKVRGNQKVKKGKGLVSPNPLLAVMAQVPKTSVKGNTKGASHTYVANMKGASHTHSLEGKKTTSSSLLSLSENKEGASNTPAPDLTKGVKDDKVLLSDGEERVLEGGEDDKAQRAKDQLAATVKYLARELIDAGGPLLSDTLDANHMACYQALDAERISLSECTRKEECAFTAVEMWQQAVEMVQQSDADNREYTALVDEEWQYQQYRELFKKRANKVLSTDTEPGSLIGTDPDAVKRRLTGAAQRLQ